jgi:hypothetical protein
MLMGVDVVMLEQETNQDYHELVHTNLAKFALKQ